MSDVFVSYRRGDEARVGQLVETLRSDGFSVWWDQDIAPSAPWEATIEAEIQKAKAVVVCWSKSAVASENVRAEARWAREQQKLLQTYVEPCTPPLFFSEQQAIDFSKQGQFDGPRYEALRKSIIALCGGERVWTPVQYLNYDRSEAAAQNARAGPWEASQFGLKLCLFALPFLTLWTIAMSAANVVATPTPYNPYFGPWLAGVGLIALGALGLFPAGWLTYLVFARRPNRVGFFRGAFMALLISIAAGILPFLLVAMTSFAKGLEASIFFVLFVISGTWLRAYLYVSRHRPTDTGERTRVVALAFILPLVACVGVSSTATWLGGLDETAENVAARLRNRGLTAPPDGENWAYVSPDTVQRVRTRLGLPASGSADVQLYEALGRTPVKIWVLAADGSGDARTLEELAARTHGGFTVIVRPGIYTVAEHDDAWSDPLHDILARRDDCPRAYNSDWSCNRAAVTITGQGRRDEIILESWNVPISSGSRIRGVTLRTPSRATETAAYGAARAAANEDARRWGRATYGSPDFYRRWREGSLFANQPWLRVEDGTIFLGPHINEIPPHAFVELGEASQLFDSAVHGDGTGELVLVGAPMPGEAGWAGPSAIGDSILNANGGGGILVDAGRRLVLSGSTLERVVGSCVAVRPRGEALGGVAANNMQACEDQALPRSPALGPMSTHEAPSPQALGAR